MSVEDPLFDDPELTEVLFAAMADYQPPGDGTAWDSLISTPNADLATLIKPPQHQLTKLETAVFDAYARHPDSIEWVRKYEETDPDRFRLSLHANPKGLMGLVVLELDMQEEDYAGVRLSNLGVGLVLDNTVNAHMPTKRHPYIDLPAPFIISGADGSLSYGRTPNDPEIHPLPQSGWRFWRQNPATALARAISERGPVPTWRETAIDTELRLMTGAQ